MDVFDAHYGSVTREALRGRVVPLLGAGVNLSNRPPDTAWGVGSEYLPSGRELAEYLAVTYYFPEENTGDLLRVSQYAAATAEIGSLYDELRTIFQAKYEPTEVHRFLLTLAKQLGMQDPPKYQLIVTTNYDDALERVFAEANEPLDVVWYIAVGSDRGKFWHRPTGGEPRLIERPNEYDELDLDARTVLLKIHGSVDRAAEDRDSYVITEDDYIEYLSQSDVAQLIPHELLARLKRTCFLFLGYSMQDWNLRVILHRIWGDQKLARSNWAIQKAPSEIDRTLWAKRNVDVLDIPLDEYVRELEQRLPTRAPDPVA